MTIKQGWSGRFFEDFVEVLHDHCAVVIVRGFVLPVLGFDAVAATVVLTLSLVIEVEAAEQHDLASSFAELGPMRLGPPAVGVAVVVSDYSGELLVRCIARAFALQADDYGL